MSPTFPYDPFAILGLPAGAALKEVSKAFRKLAIRHHPDTSADKSGVKYRQIQEAYEAICRKDVQQRRQEKLSTKRPSSRVVIPVTISMAQAYYGVTLYKEYVRNNLSLGPDGQEEVKMPVYVPRRLLNGTSFKVPKGGNVDQNGNVNDATAVLYYPTSTSDGTYAVSRRGHITMTMVLPWKFVLEEKTVSHALFGGKEVVQFQLSYDKPSGFVYIVHGKGFGVSGDLYFTVKYATPRDLSAEDRKRIVEILDKYASEEKLSDDRAES